MASYLIKTQSRGKLRLFTVTSPVGHGWLTYEFEATSPAGFVTRTLNMVRTQIGTLTNRNTVLRTDYLGKLRVAVLMGTLYFLLESQTEQYFSRGVTFHRNARPADILSLRDYCKSKNRNISNFHNKYCVCGERFKSKSEFWEHVLLYHCLIETIELEPRRHEGYFYCDNNNCRSPDSKYSPSRETEFKKHLFLTCEGKNQNQLLQLIIVYDIDPTDLKKIHILPIVLKVTSCSQSQDKTKRQSKNREQIHLMLRTPTI